jgi:hypothetical protein
MLAAANKEGATRMNKTLLCVLAVLTIPAGAVRAADHPELKEGLWQIHMQFLDASGKVTHDGTSQMCRSHDYDKTSEVKSHALMAKMCGQPSESMSGNQFTSEVTCKVPGSGSTSVTKSVVTFSGDTATHTESHTTYTPAYNGMTTESMIQDQKYLGACPSGMQPGDRKSADGTISHSGLLK